MMLTNQKRNEIEEFLQPDTDNNEIICLKHHELHSLLRELIGKTIDAVRERYPSTTSPGTTLK